MNSTADKKQESKFVVDGEIVQTTEPTSPPSNTNHSTHAHKKQMRHPVKRKSSGRAHVTKLAPMAKYSDAEDGNERPIMKRSQSQRSLHRLPFDRKLTPAQPSTTATTTSTTTISTAAPMTTTTTAISDTASLSPPVAAPPPPPSAAPNVDQTEDQHRRPKNKNNPLFLSYMTTAAAPVAQIFDTVADSLVIPDQAAVPTMHHAASTAAAAATAIAASSFSSSSAAPGMSSSSARPPGKQDKKTAKKIPLRSQFLSADQDARRCLSDNVSNSSGHSVGNISRTQQKLLLQRQHCLVDDENNPGHPRNMLRLTRELERVGREYRCVRQYQDPMRESILRCIDRREAYRQGQHHPVSLPSLPPPTSSSDLHRTVSISDLPNLEHKLDRHHRLKAIAGNRARTVQAPHASSSLSSTSSVLAQSTHPMANGHNWSSLWLDRLWHLVSPRNHT
ncbi:hypothetical protein EC973_007367 [Apophysomyces ossiformis]|uniref:Uncharacterized protein n=1 Tax=Apophysomyces ossiformis TaxID=679940 RepID=A0A8H7BME0_9FUNG|nr:hypothetical protein EC973_007367 [Apophysomyces ossiformis]